MRVLDNLTDVIKKAEQRVNVGAIYAHYSDAAKFYKVLAIAINEETDDPCVVYQALYGDGLIWVRTVSVWCDLVKHNGHTVIRFIRKNGDILTT